MAMGWVGFCPAKYIEFMWIRTIQTWVLYGFIWFYMVLYGFIWFYMVSYGFIWLYMVLSSSAGDRSQLEFYLSHHYGDTPLANSMRGI